jgi:hypothetical protein
MHPPYVLAFASWEEECACRVVNALTGTDRKVARRGSCSGVRGRPTEESLLSRRHAHSFKKSSSLFFFCVSASIEFTELAKPCQSGCSDNEPMIRALRHQFVDQDWIGWYRSWRGSYI